MQDQIQSIIQYGATGILIDIECTLSNSLPAIVVVGLGGKAVAESKERIRSALNNTRVAVPRKRITINLAPADIPKESASLDLAMAVAILSASKQLKRPLPAHSIFLGELGLDGSLRPVRGIIGKILAAQQFGINTFFIPEGNTSQAKLIPHITIFPLRTLGEFYTAYSNDPQELSGIHTNDRVTLPHPQQHSAYALSNIVGQQTAKRALEISAAGNHNILLYGPPGTGKSMLAKALPSLLPPLTHHEALEVTHLHSLASNNYEKLYLERPFRAPHHSASHISIIGGGASIRPGEISLSHCGILFLDEMPEFNRMTIEALRQPLEDRAITISRAKLTLTYPANLLLVATANPCPCGYLNTEKECCCSAYDIRRYNQRISGPIIDRIDLHVAVEHVDHSKLLVGRLAESSDQAVLRVAKARQIQHQRYGDNTKLNANMNNEDLLTHVMLTPKARNILNSAAKKLSLSARSYIKIAKVGRTIADLEQAQYVSESHIGEALQYRPRIDS